MSKEEYIKRFEEVQANIGVLIDCIKNPKFYKAKDDHTISDLISCYSDQGEYYINAYDEFIQEHGNEIIESDDSRK